MATDPIFGDLFENKAPEAPPTLTTPPAPVVDSVLGDLFAQPTTVAPTTDSPLTVAPAVPLPTTNPLGDLFGPSLGEQPTPQWQYDQLRASGDEPALDDAEPGFTSALKGGTANLVSSLRVPLLLFGEMVTEWAEQEFPNSPSAQYLREQTELERSFLAESDATAAAAPISLTFQRLAEAGSIESFFDTFMESDEKWTAIKELIGLSLPFSAGMIVGTIAGGLPGTATSVFAMDWGDSYRESLRQGKTKDEALTSATLKAMTQAGFDTATMGIARIKLANNVFKDGLAQLGVQMLGGGGAEVAKHELVGEDYTVGGVLLEAAGELVTGLPEVGFARATAPKGAKGKTIKELQTQLSELLEKRDYEQAQIELPTLMAQIQARLEAAAEEEGVETLSEMKTEGLTGSLPYATGMPLFSIGGGRVNQVASVQWWDNTSFIDPETGAVIGAMQYDFDKGPVVLTQETFLNQKIRDAEASLALAKEREAIALAEGRFDDASIEFTITNHFTSIITQLTSQREVEFDYARKAQSILTELVEALSPSMKVVYSTNHAGEVMSVLKQDSEWNVKTGTGHNWNLSNGTTVIELNLDAFIRGTDGGVNEAAFAEALVHEFGHALIAHEYKNTSPKIKRAMQNAWLKWLKKLLQSKTKEEYFNNRLSPSISEFFVRRGSKAGQKKISPPDMPVSIAKKEYDWGMEEWAANEMSRLLQTSSVVKDPVSKFFSDIIAKLRQLWELVEGKYAATDTFQDFVNLLAAKTALGKLEAVSQLDSMTKAEAGREARAVVRNIAKELGLKMPKGPAPPGVNFPHEADNMDGTIDRYGFFSRWAANLLQVAERNLHISGLRKYVENIRSWWTDKMKFIARADERLHEWRKLGDKRAAAVGAFMQDLTVLSYENNKKYKPGKPSTLTEADANAIREQIGEITIQLDNLEQGIVPSLYESNFEAMTEDQYPEMIDSIRDILNKQRQELVAQLPENNVINEFDRLVKKHGLDQEQLDMVAKIEADFNAVLDELYNVLLADANKSQDVIDRMKVLDKLNEDFEALRNRNFYPLSRFGEYYMRVKAKTDMVFEGKEYKAGEVITFEMFEAPAMFTAFRMDTPPVLKRREARFRDNALFEVSSGIVNDTQRQFSGLPPQFLEMMRDRLDLTEIQKRELDNLLRDIAPGRSFTKHMKTRKNVNGYSSDALRAYADYFMHFANYVARIKYKGVLQDNIGEVRASANTIAEATGNAVKRGRIAQYMQDHFDYVMNPDNEWENLRAVGFLWYLGFVPKSAFVNLTQTIFVTQPWLASRFGDIAATKELGKAMKDAFGAFKNRTLREDQNKLIDYLVETGIIEESMATEVAAVAEGRAFSRTATNTLFGSQKFGSAIRASAGYGAWMFQMAERYNRRVTALAAYELVLKQGIPIRNQQGKLTGEFRPATEKAAFLFAQQAVEGSQFEYARFNRPRFMRGKKSIFFLFWQYMQNMLYFTGNDPGAARYILIMLLAAGLSGLPFAEDAMDIFDFLAKKMNKWFKDESMLPINIRKELREVAASIGANPDLVMHGASRYSLGLPFLTEAVGLPMPMVDVSGSISMGRIVPGIEQLTRSDAPMSGSLGRAAEEAGGAVASIPLQLLYAVADDNPDTWRRWERAAPTMVQHLSKALRYTIREEATTPEGAVIKDFYVPEDRMDLAQVLFQAAGFADTEVNRAQEEHYMKKDILAYYELRKRMYLEDLAYAKRTGDSKHFQVIMQDIRRFNRDLRTIGLPDLAAGPATIRRSLKERMKKKVFIEHGFPGGKRGAGVSRQVERAFPDEEETVESLPRQ